MHDLRRKIEIVETFLPLRRSHGKLIDRPRGMKILPPLALLGRHLSARTHLVRRSVHRDRLFACAAFPRAKSIASILTAAIRALPVPATPVAATTATPLPIIGRAFRATDALLLRLALLLAAGLRGSILILGPLGAILAVPPPLATLPATVTRLTILTFAGTRCTILPRKLGQQLSDKTKCHIRNLKLTDGEWQTGTHRNGKRPAICQPPA